MDCKYSTTDYFIGNKFVTAINEREVQNGKEIISRSFFNCSLGYYNATWRKF